MHHSDRGSQYASQDYQLLLANTGIIVNMSCKGNCWDNAVMERFFGSLKLDVIDYIEMFYNSERLHSTLEYVLPLQFEQNNYILLD